MANFVNNIEYGPQHIFEILSVKDNEAYTTGFVDENIIGNLQFKDLEHGMMLKNGSVIKKINKDNFSHKESFYFLHIAKNSGISLQEELKNVFKEEQSFINNIGYLNEFDMLNSKLISGHLAMYPFDLFKKNNKNIHGITILRNPIDRAISYFMFISKVFDSMLHRQTDNVTNKNFDNFLSDPINRDLITNFQTRSITSTLNTDKASYWSNKYLNRSIDRFQLMAAMSSNSNFIAHGQDGSLWRDSLNKFDIIGTVEYRELFLNNLSVILQKNKYFGHIRNIKKNTSNLKLQKIKSTLTKGQIDQIVELNNYDFEMYDFLMKNKGVWEC